MKSNNDKLNLTTLTPLFIGSDEGSDLSPTTDFIFDKGVIKIIDQRKFELLLGKDVNLINEFISEVKSKSYSFDLKSFIENKLHTALDDIIKAIIDVEGLLSSKTIATFIPTLGKPYIPGSSLKGAIRTAIISNYLSNDKKGQDIVNRLLNVKKEIDELKKKKDNGELLTKEEFEKLKPYGIKKYFNTIYNEFILFKNKEYGHDFRHMKISDSNPLKVEQTKIVKLIRIYLTKNEEKTSQWKQVLRENISTIFCLNINPEVRDNFLSKINNNSLNELFSLINSFSKDFIDFESKMYNTFSKNKAVESKLKGVIEFYDSLKKLINQSDNKYAIIRVGGGKTYFDNSIGLALFKKDPAAFKAFRKLLGFWKHRSGNRSFVEEDSPITRTFYNAQNELYPLGWVILYPYEHKEFVNKNLSLFNNEKNSQNMTAKNTDPLELLKQKFKVTESQKNK